MGRGIGQWVDELELFDDRARPSVRDDDRKRVLVPRTNVDEMNIETVDLGDEVRHGVEPRLGLAPVVFRAPVASQLLDGRERHALREIRDGLAVGQARRANTPAQIVEVRLGKVDAEGTDDGGITHDLLLSVGGPACRLRRAEASSQPRSEQQTSHRLPYLARISRSFLIDMSSNSQASTSSFKFTPSSEYWRSGSLPVCAVARSRASRISSDDRRFLTPATSRPCSAPL